MEAGISDHVRSIDEVTALYDLVSQQQVSCVFLLNLQTNLPSCTVQQHDDVTSLPVSLHTICAPNTGQISNAAANRPSNAVFIFRFALYSNPTVFAIKLTPTEHSRLYLIALTARVVDSSSKNAVSFSSARTTKRFPSSRCASAIQIVRPLESIAET